MENYKLINNEKAHRYEFEVGNQHPYIEYMVSKDGVIYLTHTIVPSDLGGQGIGTELVKQALEDIDQRDLKMVPMCGFVVSYIKKNPEWKRVLSEGTYVG